MKDDYDICPECKEHTAPMENDCECDNNECDLCHPEIPKCELCGFILEEDDDVDYDGATYIGGSMYMYCPNSDLPEDDDHTFRRFS